MDYLQVIGPVLQLIGTVGRTVSEINTARQNADIAKANAEAARLEAESIGKQTEIEERQQRKETRRVLSKQQAVLAASGLETTSGSPLEIALDSAKEGELNALNIRYSGELKQRSKLFESDIYKRQSRLYKSQIPGIILGGIGETGSILGDWFYRRQSLQGGGPAAGKSKPSGGSP